MPTLLRAIFLPLLTAVASALLATTTVSGAPGITEFMAANSRTLSDDDGDFSDWIEIHNPDSTPVSLAGWYLTDTAKNKTKWQFPEITIPAGGHLVVFASNKDRRDPSQPLHANFALSADGEYLGLIHPDGITASTEFAPAFPAQVSDISYGFTETHPAVAGYLRESTPGALNNTDAIDLFGQVSFSRPPGLFVGQFLLELSGADTGQHIRYTILAPSASGAEVSDPTADSAEYTGPITISSSVVVRAAVFSDDDRLRGPSRVAQFVKIDPGLASFASQLPLLVLDNHGLGQLEKDGIDHASWIYAFDTALGASSLAQGPGHALPATMTVRGNFTALFPKKSYSLTLFDDRGAKKPLPFLGLDTSEDWALVSPWYTDRSFIRNAYVYALSNQIGRWAPRTRFVEVFVNDDEDGLDASDYHGIAVLTDRLKVGPDRIAITPLTSADNTGDALTGGYVVKIDAVPDEDHYTFVTGHGVPAAGDTAVIVDTPNAAKLTAAQQDYIRGYIQAMENALFADQNSGYATRTYLDYIDVPSWIDHHLLEVFFGNVDGLYRSDYFYKDRSGKMVSGPVWDFDSSIGNGDDRGLHWDTWQTAGDVDVWSYGWWGPLTHDPEFMQGWIDRWQSLRREQFSDTNLRAVAESLAAQIGPDAAWRDAARWVDDESRFPGGIFGEVGYLVDWITRRAGWIDRQFVEPPRITSTGGTLQFTTLPGTQLVYTLDGSDPRSFGGAIAPGVFTTSGPLAVPETANVHVRSYRADMAGVFPGTPWSSAASGPASSPLYPRARLVNLSSRGIVSSGENTLVAGLVVADTHGKRFLSRAVGPTLAHYDAATTVADPQLSVLTASGIELFRNNGWETGPDGATLRQVFNSVGAFPLDADSADSAVVAPLGSGNYSLHMSSPTGRNGIGLVELYTLDDNGRTLNLSTRAFVGSGGDVLVSGFVVQGPAYQRILIRGIGPSLRGYGIADPLADPVLTLFSDQTPIASNDRWGAAGNAAGLRAAMQAVGAFDLAENSEDAALLITVPPGLYSAVVSGKDGRQGIGLLELYVVP
jgi:hypothetical protein